MTGSPSPRSVSDVDLVVERVLNGTAPEQLAVAVGPCHSATAPGASSVIALEEREGRWWYGGTFAAVQADALAGRVPVASGVGPARAIVAVDWGPITLVALDEAGQPLGFGTLPAVPSHLSMCPGGRRMLAVRLDDRGGVIDTIDVATLASIGARPVDDPPSSIVCTDERGDAAWLHNGPLLLRFAGGIVTPRDRTAEPMATTPDGHFLVIDAALWQIATLDPDTGQLGRRYPVASEEAVIEAVAADHRGRVAAVWGERISIEEAEPGDPLVGPRRLTVFDGGAPPVEIDLDHRVMAINLRWAGERLAVTYRDGPAAYLQLVDPSAGADRRSTIDEPRMPDSVSMNPATPTDLGIRSAIDDADPARAAWLLTGALPTLEGVPSTAAAALPAGTAIEIAPAAAHPALAKPAVPNGARPEPVDRGTTSLARGVGIIVAVAAGAAILAVAVSRRRRRRTAVSATGPGP